MSKVKFGEFLTNARKSVGLSSGELSDALGVHRTTYRRWERGLVTPHQDEYIIKQTVKYMVKQHMKKMNAEWERLLSI